MRSRLPIPARLVFRLSLTVSLALALAYAMGMALPYTAPIFALVLSVKPQPAFHLKKLLGLLILVILTSGIGLMMIPALIHFRYLALAIILLGLFFSNVIALNKGKGGVASFLSIGLTLITAVGVMDFPAALEVAKGLMLGIGIAVVCQWIVFPFFPLNDMPQQPPAPQADPEDNPSSWRAACATLVTFPVYLLGLHNPSLYLAIILKAISIGQQETVEGAKNSIKEILGSTLVGGGLAIMIWLGLSMKPNLWMFALWTLLATTYIAAKLYRVFSSNYPPSFWVASGITMLILIGPAVADSANGKSVWQAFAMRISFFFAVSLYAWVAIQFLEFIRKRRNSKHQSARIIKEVSPCS